MSATAPSRLKLKTFVLTAIVVLSLASVASAQNVRLVPHVRDEDHTIVFEIGPAGDWSRAEGFHPGATFAFEVTPIENWLEFEVGVTAIRADGGVEMPFDVLFKKPWRFSPSFEFMIGMGPELVHVSGSGRGTFWGLEGVADLMFWPRRNVGWYVEPGYEVTFRDGTPHHSLGIAVGLLVGR
jgi:hypothetical protein